MQKILFWLIIVPYNRIAIFAYNDLKAEEQKEPMESNGSKIIQCASLEEIAKIAGQKGLKIVWSGTGIANSDNLGVVRTDIF